MFLLKYDFKSVIATTITFLFLCGCAGSIDKRIAIQYPQNKEYGGWPDQKLEKRFQEYWFDRFNGRFEDAFQMETPYLREVVDFEKYHIYLMHSTSMQLNHIEVQKIEHETDSIVVISCVIQTRTVGSEKNINTEIIDRWLTMGGKWYHVLKDPILLSF